MKSILFCLFIFISPMLHASPDNITFIFLTEESSKAVLDLVTPTPFGALIAEASQPKDCVPMGDGCFHPQHGFIPNEEEDSSKKPKKREAVSEQSKVKTINSLETNLIKCEKGNYFDIFCGKSRKEGKPGELEIWFDVSTSMRKVDWNHKDAFCKRRAFGEKLRRDCKKGVSFSVYNTSIKQVSSLNSVCTYKGDNNTKRLTKWIDGSKAKHLVIITDIDEMSAQLKDYLDMLGAKIVGVGTKPFFSTDLSKWSKKNLKSCY